MRLCEMLIFLIVLSGCRSVLDPAPYVQNIDPMVLNANLPSFTPVNILHFKDLEEAETKTQALSNGYTKQRNDLMRQQLLFDIPLIGLAIATVTTGIYHGSTETILGLGIGTATMAGARLYFGPQTKVSAYHSAAFALSCASSVAGEMVNVRANFEERGKETVSRLSANLVRANTSVLTQSGSADDRANLLAARDQAQKALDDLSSALVTLSSAPTQLKTFAIMVIKGATNKVVTGTQNLDAVLTVIRATPTAVPTPKPSTSTVAAAAATLRGLPVTTIAELVQALREDTHTAALIAKHINDTWSTLAACAVTP